MHDRAERVPGGGAWAVCPDDGARAATVDPLDPAVPLDLPPGLVVDGCYRIVRRIGSGGVGSVFEAERLGTRERVAVKIVHPAWARLAEVDRRFRREAEALGAIRSPRVVAVLGSGLTDTAWGALPYLAMELLRGRPISRFLDVGPLDPAWVAAIGVAALEALADVHAHGVIHRDVKPENLILDEDSPPPSELAAAGGAHEPRITLIDFGLSRTLLDEAPGRLTRVGFTVGTPMYMAPEQALGDEHADHRIDLFSLGVTLYELLTGRLPFDGPSNTVVLSRVLAQTPPPPRTLRDDIPPLLDAVVMRALEKDPACRFADAGAFRGALLEAIPSP
jgi:serine/threonine-protein kinase